MEYEVYIDGELLPVTPDKISSKVGGQNKTMSLISGDEINILKSPKLAEISFDVLLPARKYPFSHNTGSVLEWLDRFERLKAGRKYFRLIIIRPDTLFDTNLKVSLEDYAIKEDAASQGLDTIVSLSFLEYRNYGVKTVVLKQEQETNPAVEVTKPREAKEPEKTHTIVYGDTLWGICKKYLGNGAKYPEIAALNKIPDPNNIPIGTVIRLE